MIKQIKSYKIKGNPNNPRIVKDSKFHKLVASIKEFPEMLKLRPIVVDENMTILGGNMRWKASKEAGLKDVWIIQADNLTDAKKKEFIIKDNVNYGEWNWDILANEWNTAELDDWGMDIWKNFDDMVQTVNASNENDEWVGMPEFESKEDTLKLIVHFDNEQDREEFAQKHNIELTIKGKTTWSTTYPYSARNDLSSLSYE
jgi:hypothetical protein